MFLTSRYALQRHGRKRLEVARSLTWSEVIVRLDGVELGRTDEAALREGVEYRLRDDSVLRIWIEHGPRNSRFLMLARNGHPLPGSEGDPVKILRFTIGIVWTVAAIQILLAVMVLWLRNDRVDEVIYWMLALGSALILLGVLAWKRSIAATVGACAICFAELVVVLATQGHINLGNVWSLLFALGIFGWLLLRGIKAAQELKAMSLPIRHPPEPMHPSDAP